MRRLFIPICFCLAIFTACNTNNSPSNSSQDSTSSGGKGEAANSTLSSNDSTSSPAIPGDGSLMTAMQKNMADMQAMQSSGDPDHDFASMMKVHHSGAIDMSKMELAQGNDAELKQLAQKIISDQQQEISDFDMFLTKHKPTGGSDMFFKKSMDMMTNMKMDMNHSGTINKQYAEMMVLHHQGAIDMSDTYLQSNGKEKEIRTLATQIKTANQKEKAQLQTWLSNHK